MKRFIYFREIPGVDRGYAEEHPGLRYLLQDLEELAWHMLHKLLEKKELRILGQKCHVIDPTGFKIQEFQEPTDILLRFICEPHGPSVLRWKHEADCSRVA